MENPMICLSHISENQDLLDQFKQEIHKWVINAAQLSLLHKDEYQARQFAKEKVLDVFANAPSKQHCFEIKLNTTETIGRTWLMEKDTIEQPELRIAYIKIDEPYQGKEFAGQAIDLIEEFGLKMGYHKFSLNVFGHLPHAARLYRKLNFKVAHETIRNGQLITTEMVKILPDLAKKI